jgi:hypothetical protein
LPHFSCKSEMALIFRIIFAKAVEEEKYEQQIMVS